MKKLIATLVIMLSTSGCILTQSPYDVMVQNQPDDQYRSHMYTECVNGRWADNAIWKDMTLSQTKMDCSGYASEQLRLRNSK